MRDGKDYEEQRAIALRTTRNKVKDTVSTVWAKQILYVKNKKRMTIDAHNIFRLSARFYSCCKSYKSYADKVSDTFYRDQVSQETQS